MAAHHFSTVPAGVDPTVALQTVRARVAAGKADGPAEGSAEADVPYLWSDHMLLRFLAARQWNAEKAIVMLREHYKWLAETRMLDLLQDPFPEETHIKKFYPQNFHGTDKQGRPIYIERPGFIDMPRLLQVMTPERILEYIYASTEKQIRCRLPACSLARGEVVDKSLNIVDLSNLGFRIVTHTTARRVLKDVIVTLQNHYPECTGQILIINAPKVFSIAWSFIKPLLDEKTVSKISIHGADIGTYRQVLLELVDADQLPSLFGGSCKCDGNHAESCMNSVKGPWADPEILKILESRPLEEIMTPEGSLTYQAKDVSCSLPENTKRDGLYGYPSTEPGHVDSSGSEKEEQPSYSISSADNVANTLEPMATLLEHVAGRDSAGLSVADAQATVPPGKVPNTRGLFHRHENAEISLSKSENEKTTTMDQDAAESELAQPRPESLKASGFAKADNLAPAPAKEQAELPGPTVQNTVAFNSFQDSEELIQQPGPTPQSTVTCNIFPDSGELMQQVEGDNLVGVLAKGQAELPGPAIQNTLACNGFPDSEELLQQAEAKNLAPVPATEQAGLPGPAVQNTVACNGFQDSEELMQQLKEADLEVLLLCEECNEHEEAHGLELQKWVEESNKLTQDIGCGVIERAQEYYDALSILQQLEAEYSKIDERLDQSKVELEKATMNLSIAEDAFEAFMAGYPDISEEYWSRLAPLDSAELPEAVANDPKLLRSLRLSSLADHVARAQNERESLASELALKGDEIGKAKRRLEHVNALHSKCTSSCSIQRAAPFYTRRQVHGDIILAQQNMMHSVMVRLQHAQLRVAQLRSSLEESLHITPTEELAARHACLQDFELAGAVT